MNYRLFFATGFSASEGFTAGFTTAFTADEKISSNPGVITLFFVITGVLQGLKTYYFQGQAILDEGHGHHEHIPHAPGHKASVANKTIQVLFLGFNIFTTFTNRYYLWKDFSDNVLELSPIVFWTTLTLDLITKTAFDATNESYETAQGLASKLAGRPIKPFYHDFFVPLYGQPCYLYLFGVWGSLEHMLGEAVIPWCLFLADMGFTYNSLKKSDADFYGGGGSALGLLTILFVQTFLFEFKHTMENLSPDDDHYVAGKLPGAWLFKHLFLNFMAPIHALENFVTVYYPAKSVFSHATGLTETEKDILTDASFVLAMVSAVICLVGTQLSEVKHAKVTCGDTCLDSHVEATKQYLYDFCCGADLEEDDHHHHHHHYHGDLEMGQPPSQANSTTDSSLSEPLLVNTP